MERKHVGEAQEETRFRPRLGKILSTIREEVNRLETPEDTAPPTATDAASSDRPGDDECLTP